MLRRWSPTWVALAALAVLTALAALVACASRPSSSAPTPVPAPVPTLPAPTQATEPAPTPAAAPEQAAWRRAIEARVAGFRHAGPNDELMIDRGSRSGIQMGDEVTFLWALAGAAESQRWTSGRCELVEVFALRSWCRVPSGAPRSRDVRVFPSGAPDGTIDDGVVFIRPPAPPPPAPTPPPEPEPPPVDRGARAPAAPLIVAQVSVWQLEPERECVGFSADGHVVYILNHDVRGLATDDLTIEPLVLERIDLRRATSRRSALVPGFGAAEATRALAELIAREGLYACHEADARTLEIPPATRRGEAYDMDCLQADHGASGTVSFIADAAAIQVWAGDPARLRKTIRARPRDPRRRDSSSHLAARPATLSDEEVLDRVYYLPRSPYHLMMTSFRWVVARQAPEPARP